MFEYEESPPPLHHSPSLSDRSQFTSRDTTPVTPVGLGPWSAKRSDKEREGGLPWFKKPIDVGRTTTSLCLDTSLLKPDFDDNTYPQFGSAPPSRGRVSTSTTSMDMSTRQTSTSPRGNQPSTLTSALQRENGNDDKRKTHGTVSENGRLIPQISHEVSSDFSGLENGAKPITMKGKSQEKPRRESTAQSMGAGMSWGGVSVGSWIRDDMVMSGTSPFAFQSPSYHSSSYLPKLEASFMKDFSCCGLTLPSLHDLLQHYEEAHAQKDPIQQDMNPQPLPDSRAAIATNTAAQIQQETQQRNQIQNQLANGPGRPFGSSSNISQAPHRPSGFSNTLQTIPDMDTVEDMEMDDINGPEDPTTPSALFSNIQSQASPPGQFTTVAQTQIPQLNTGMMQGYQTHRQSTPNTPVVPGRSSAFQGTNTPSTLTANPMQQYQDLQNQYRSTPDSSSPGTPGELDESLMAGLDDMSVQNNPLFSTLPNGFGNFAFGTNSDMIDLCIDEPAKRLFQQTGGQSNQYQGHQRLGSGQYGANSDLAKTIRDRQIAAGLPDTATNILPHEEPKPFRCPVIGCEKAYKNQNGLKYHKSHGHNNQSLHENGDGTFSIVNPDTQAPYPGMQGMEKEKPYKCDVCQKRYKNLNGLKYHKTHSPPCNPDLLINPNRNVSGGMPNMMTSPGMSSLGPSLSGDHPLL